MISCTLRLQETKNYSMDFDTSKLIKLQEVDEDFVLLTNLFYLNCVSISYYFPVVEIHRSAGFKDTREACLDALFLFSSSLLRNCTKNLGITYAWHGTSRDVISQIFGNGSGSVEPRDNEFCRALYLSQDPQCSAVDSILSSEVDNGLVHIIFCRIISQDLPQVAMAWKPYVDRHIQPLYVVTIKPACKIEELLRTIESSPVSSLVSKKISGPAILAMLSEHLSLPKMYVLRKAFNDCWENKIDVRMVLLQLWEVAGEELLKKIHADYMNRVKEIEGFSQKKELAVAGSSKTLRNGGPSA